MRNATLGALLSLCIAVGPACLGGEDGDLQDDTGSLREALGPVVCGNDVCEILESCRTCPVDCGPCEPFVLCGDGRCDRMGGESLETCEVDCAVCGDGDCNGDEDLETCEVDCAVCGDGDCNGDETRETCSQDCCSLQPVCGDGNCRFEVCDASSCEAGMCCFVCAADCCGEGGDGGDFEDDGIEPSCDYDGRCEPGEFEDCHDCDGVVVDPTRGGPAEPEWPGR